MPTFEYHSQILETFPHVVGGVLIGIVRNTPTPQTLFDLYQAEQERVKTRIGEDPLSSLPSLSAWRSAFQKFGVQPTKYRSAAEALLRRLTKKGDIPSINTLVDLGNLVSIRYGLPLAVFDVRNLVDDHLSVRIATGTEKFLPLGTKDIEYPNIGEVIFADGGDNVYARRWCWRQSQGSAAREDTTQVIVIIESQHEGGEADIQSAMQDLQALLTDYANFTGSTGIASASSPRVVGDV